MFNTNLIVGVAVVVLVGGGVVFYFFNGSNATRSGTNTAEVIATSGALQAKTPAPVKETSSAPASDQKKKTITTPPSETKPLPPTKPRLSPGKITAYITDQYGNEYGGSKYVRNYGSSYELVDALGESVPIDYPDIKNGVLETNALPAGKYTIYVPSRRFVVDETPLIKTFDLPSEGINLGHLTIMRWGQVKVKVTNEVGTPLKAVYWVFVKCEIRDEYVVAAEARKRIFLICDRRDSIAESAMTFPVGVYTIRISSDGYLPVEKTFEVNNRDIDLGTVVLKKE